MSTDVGVQVSSLAPGLSANFDDTASNAVSSMLSGLFQLGNFFIFPLTTNAVFMQLRRLELPEPGFGPFYLSSAADFRKFFRYSKKINITKIQAPDCWFRRINNSALFFRGDSLRLCKPRVLKRINNSVRPELLRNQRFRPFDV